MGPPLYSNRATQDPVSPTPSPTPTLVNRRIGIELANLPDIRSVRFDWENETEVGRAIAYFYDTYPDETIEDALEEHPTINYLLSTHLYTTLARLTHRRVESEALAFYDVLNTPGQQPLAVLAKAIADQAHELVHHLHNALDSCEWALADAGIVPVFRGLFPEAFGGSRTAAATTTTPLRAREGHPRPLAGTTRRRSPSPAERRVRPRRDSDVENIPPDTIMAYAPTRPNTPPDTITASFPPQNSVDEDIATAAGLDDSPPPLPISPPREVTSSSRFTITPPIYIPQAGTDTTIASTSAAVQCGFCMGTGHSYVSCPLWVCPGCHLEAPGHMPSTCPNPRYPRTWDNWAALYQSPSHRPPTPRPTDSFSILQWPDGPRHQPGATSEEEDPME